MNKFLVKTSCLSILLTSVLFNCAVDKAIAQTLMNEDDLDSNGLPWAGKRLPFKQIVNIKDTLVGSPLGKIVIDRHGEDPYGLLIKTPLSYPEPGKWVVVSFWGSKIEGCFVRLVFQWAPAQNQTGLSEGMKPVSLELGIDGKIVQLTPNPNVPVRSFSTNYSYIKSENNTQYYSTYYMTDTLFSVNAEVAELLRNAPPGEVRVRLNFPSIKVIFPLGKETVKLWNESYGFNSSCSPSQ
jgi:hypothetical protein